MQNTPDSNGAKPNSPLTVGASVDLSRELQSTIEGISTFISQLEPGSRIELLRRMPPFVQSELLKREIELIKQTVDKPTPEMCAAALESLDEEELLREIQEIQRTGGLKLSDFIDEFERIAARNG